MLEFNHNDDNKQFVSVVCDTIHILPALVFFAARMTAANIRYDESELVVEIPEHGGMGFSLNDVRSTLLPIMPEAVISTFAVDCDIPSGRLYPVQ